MKQVKEIKFQGETLPAKEWGKRYNLSAATILMRLHRGWSIEKTFSGIPVCMRYLINGENLTVGEIAKKYKINQTTLYERIRRGWTIDELISICLSHASVNRGVDEFNFMMRRFYTKEQRLESYKQLKKDFEEMQRLQKAA